MQEIPLTQGHVAIVDDVDFEDQSVHKWRASYSSKTWYAHRDVTIDGQRFTLAMHREILKAKATTIVDHINHNGLDNQRLNLRMSSKSQNGANHNGLRRNNTSGYRGVSWAKHVNKWESQIMVNRHKKFLGMFDSKEDAAIAYDQAAIYYFGEFASLNFVLAA